MEFAVIFTEMNWIAMLLLCVGMTFIVVELFVPGFGFFGISGVVSIVIGIIVRIIQGLNLMQSLVLILMVVGFMVVSTLCLVFSAKHGILGRTGLFENSTSLPENYNKVNKRLDKLVGKSGKAISVLNLGGKAKIRGRIYDVVSINSYIDAGSYVKVVEIRDNQIMVKKWFE